MPWQPVTWQHNFIIICTCERCSYHNIDLVYCLKLNKIGKVEFKIYIVWRAITSLICCSVNVFFIISAFFIFCCSVFVQSFCLGSSQVQFLSEFLTRIYSSSEVSSAIFIHNIQSLQPSFFSLFIQFSSSAAATKSSVLQSHVMRTGILLSASLLSRVHLKLKWICSERKIVIPFRYDFMAAQNLSLLAHNLTKIGAQHEVPTFKGNISANIYWWGPSDCLELLYRRVLLEI